MNESWRANCAELEKRWGSQRKRSHEKDGTHRTERTETESKVVATVSEARGCHKREGSSSAEMVQILENTVRYVRIEW